MQAWVTEWLSEERFSTYQRAAGHDDARALALYEWNTQANSALMHDFAHLEIGIRNLYSRGLNLSLHSGETHWLESAPLLRLYPVRMDSRGKDANARSRHDVESARKRTPSGNVPGAIMAELTFGFWAMMTASRLQHSVWPHLCQVLPPKTDRHQLHAILTELNKLRNRAAHHEPVKPSVLNSATRTMASVAKYISPELATYLRVNSDLPALVDKHRGIFVQR